MNLNECYDKLDEFAKLNDGWGNFRDGKAFSGLLIERCRRLLEKMNIVPDIRPTVENCICFGYDSDDVGVEISVYDNKIEGFISDADDDYSVFVFDTEEDVVNFWNTFIGVLSKNL